MANATMRPLVAAGTTIGVGMGGFIDGIVLHQILQAHNMLSARYPPTTVVNLEINMFWDGLFHAFTWLMTAFGIALLWHAVRQPEVLLSTKAFVGSIVFGWGLFNVVEGVIDHHILHIHHVRESADHLYWDIGFLGLSVMLVVVGLWMIRSGGREARVQKI